MFLKPRHHRYINRNNAPIAQSAEAALLKGVQCQFESDWGYHYDRVISSVAERLRDMQEVKGSIPLLPTINKYLNITEAIKLWILKVKKVLNLGATIH